jgi:hypothetical protein
MIALKWDPSTSTLPVTEYIVAYRMQGKPVYARLRDEDSTDTRAVITGVLPGKLYTIRIAAVNAQGIGIFSDPYVIYTKTSSSPPSNSISGVCGGAHGQVFTTPPTLYLCAAGTPSSVTTRSSEYLWSCVGVNGGDTVSCKASIGTSSPPTTSRNITDVTLFSSLGGAQVFTFGQAFKKGDVPR